MDSSRSMKSLEAEIKMLRDRLTEVDRITTMWWQDSNHDIRSHLNTVLLTWKQIDSESKTADFSSSVSVTDDLSIRRVE